ncbi:MAG: chemotaxis protein CheW [Thiotrichales bacterium]
MEAPATNPKIQSLIVPLRQYNLLLPQSALVEVLSMPDVKQLPGVAPWITGLLGWRERDLPLVSLERYCELLPGESHLRSRRVAIIQGLLGLKGLESFGVEIQGIPHPVRLGDSDIRSTLGGSTCDLIDQFVQAAGVKCFMLRHEVLERRVETALAALS